MMEPTDVASNLRAENEELKARLKTLGERLREPEEIIRAIRNGEVDAFVVDDHTQPRVLALRQADVLYRAMIEQMQDAALALDPDGTIVFCNQYFCQLAEAARQSVIGRHIASFVSPESQTSFEDLDALVGGEIRRSEIVLRATDGNLVPMMATMNALSTEAGPVLCLILTDLREQKQREELVLESERKDQFLAMLAHELRNPIAPVTHAAEILRLKSSSEPGIRWATEVIERQVGQLTRLVDDLLDVSRITRGKIRIDLVPVDLSMVIAGAVETSQPLIQGRHHRLNVTLPPKPIYVRADTTRLTQVFANLLNNAAKFTPEGGTLSVATRVEGAEVEVVVKDNGIGIARRMLPRVFELFAQVDTSLSRTQGGLGIGLTLVRDIVQMHGGTVEARSEGEGKGTELVVRLPVIDAAAMPARSAPRPEAVVHAKRRVMVVDDNVDAAESLAELVQLWGHEVRTYNRGMQAFEQAPGFKPDVMFVDIGLPDVDGYEIARRLRRVKELDGVTLIALTGYGQEEDRRRALAAGFDKHQVKPIDVAAIEAILSSLPVPPARS